MNPFRLPPHHAATLLAALLASCDSRPTKTPETPQTPAPADVRHIDSSPPPSEPSPPPVAPPPDTPADAGKPATNETPSRAVDVAQLRTAAEQGDSQAQFALGSCFASGTDVPLDPAEAAKWFGLAADQGNADAQYRLGLCFLRGEGLPPNRAAALQWLILAAKASHADATDMLTELNHSSAKEDISRAWKMAAEWHRKHSDEPSPPPPTPP